MLKTERKKEDKGPVVRSIHRDIELQNLKTSHTSALAPGTCKARSFSSCNGATSVLWPAVEESCTLDFKPEE